MKALLRSSLLALVVFAGYAAFSINTSASLGNIGTRPQPGQIPCVSALCNK